MIFHRAKFKTTGQDVVIQNSDIMKCNNTTSALTCVTNSSE